MKKCISCGAELEDQATVCTQCGTSQASAVTGAQPTTTTTGATVTAATSTASTPVTPSATPTATTSPQAAPTNTAATPVQQQYTPQQPAYTPQPQQPNYGGQPVQPTQPYGQQPYGQAPYGQPYGQAPMAPPVEDSGSFGWAVLGFFLPLIGLILFLVWKDTKPLCAKKAGIGALVGVIAYIVLSILSSILFVGIASSYYYY